MNENTSMEELTTQDTIQEIQTPEVDAQHEQEATESNDTSQTAAPQETHKDMNLRILRERAEKAERDRDEAIQYIMKQQGHQSQAKTEKMIEEVEEDYLAALGLQDDSLLEGKHYRELAKRQKQLEKQLASYQKQNSLDTVEVRMRQQYSDFDSVIAPKNLEALRDANPELFEVIASNPDPLKQAKLAYQMVKQYGIVQDNRVDDNRLLAQKNALKPKPTAAVQPSSSPLSQANAFARSKEDVYAEMVRLSKQQ